MQTRMGTSLYDLTVPVYIRSLTNLSAILAKGEAWAAEKGLDPADLLATRLAEDMHPLPTQIQRASDTAKGVMVRVGGVDNAVYEDNEKTFAELEERIRKTIAFLRSVPREKLDGREDASVTLNLPDGRASPFTGQSFVLGFAIPNFFFHVTTAYALLRHRGVPVGKLDYLGGI
jgi:uncharacterized protein